MVNLLIADDEQIEREGMQAVLMKAFPHLNIKHAKNGTHAIEMAEKFSPELILMDIKMPGMNGLEAIERIHVKHPFTKFIMVTAYDTFDFIHQALKLGAKDYLLKPSKASEIIEIVGKVLHQIEEEKYLLNKRRIQQHALEKTLALVETDVVTQLLFDHVHDVHLDMLLEMLDLESKAEMFVLMVLVPSGSERLFSIIKEKVRETGSGLVGPLNGNQLPIIVFRDTSQSFRSQAIMISRKILSLVKEGAENGWFIGIGSVCESLNDVKQSYMDSLMATMDTKLPVKYRFFSDMHLISDSQNGLMIKQLEKEVYDEVRLGNWDEVRIRVLDIIKRFEMEGISLLEIQQRMLEVLWVISQSLNEIGVETDTPLFTFQIRDYRQLRSETVHLLEQMRQAYEQHFELLESDNIHQLKQYIADHSHEDISLEVLGSRIGLSPIYISRIFKEKLGINYIDFLTECRIEKAKKLMSDPEKSIKEITFEVGYHEPNYFSKVFKKMVGVSPKEFRHTLLKQ